MHNTTILFDLDGTLIDSTDAIIESFDVVFKQLGLNECNHNKAKSLIGYTLEDIFLKLGLKKELVPDAICKYKVHYRKISLSQTSLLPYAKEAIQNANSFAKIGIVTTKMAKYITPLLESLQIQDFFQKDINIIGFDNVTHPKPHSEPILKAIDMLNADLNNTWMIGDTKLDTQSAYNAKIKSVGVLCGYGNEQEMRKYTDFICHNSKEAVSFIKKFKK
ncbi:Phosphoglycolate phosphatase [hydrothermal vent metagenome]|uniref:Phosphoglycolate phosphatase n=1 Tax=hydrothermal vent metagenome TaxID=652676 RepID=A0A3B1EA36_9ZZZZ